MNLIGRGRHPELIALGDSNTALAHLPSMKGFEKWPQSLGTQMGWPVQNLGRQGLTINDAFERGLVDRALGSGAKYLTVGFGADDCTRVGVAQFAGLLDRLLHQAETTVTMPILLTAVWVDPAHSSTDRFNEELEPYNDAIRLAAADRGARLVDVAARMQREASRGRWDLRIRQGAMDDRRDAGKAVESGWYDGVRLNAAGSKLVAHLVLQVLRARVPFELPVAASA